MRLRGHVSVVQLDRASRLFHTNFNCLHDYWVKFTFETGSERFRARGIRPFVEHFLKLKISNTCKVWDNLPTSSFLCSLQSIVLLSEPDHPVQSDLEKTQWSRRQLILRAARFNACDSLTRANFQCMKTFSY